MEDLDKVKSGSFNPMRKNESARLLGDQYISGQYNNTGANDRYNQIEPSLKDKLINDTVKVNYLREQ